MKPITASETGRNVWSNPVPGLARPTPSCRHFTSELGATVLPYLQRIACIAFTNVAEDKTATNTDWNMIIYCDTTGAFRPHLQIAETDPRTPDRGGKIAELSAGSGAEE